MASIHWTLLLFASRLFAQSSFPVACSGGVPLPFSNIAVTHPVDGNCTIDGSADSPAATRLQNSVKNNFCATAPGGQPLTVAIKDQVKLQKKTQTRLGTEPASRDSVVALGEGTLVRMKAFIIEAHHADSAEGESVNCEHPGEEGNDIHIALGQKATSKECSSVTAEISPHFRPSAWNEIGNLSDGKTNQALAARLQAQALRFTGQRFFDASHKLCPCGSPATCHPPRSSAWEIHPVTAIDVCKKGTKCDVNNETHWVPFDEWWSQQPTSTHR
jgi:hypothetical protein